MADDFTAYSITDGGLLHRAGRALHLTRGQPSDWIRLAGAAVLITYVPVLLFGLAWRLAAGAWLPGLAHLDLHVRALVAIPLLLAAEPLVEARARSAGRYLLQSNVIRPGLDAQRDAVARTARLRDSALVEALLLLVAIATALPGATHVSGVSVFQWASLPSIALLRFLLLRWLWRWTLWGLYLFRLARRPLVLRATHPDRLAGLGPLLAPAHGFALVVAGVSAAIAGGWGDLMLHQGASAKAFSGVAITFVATAVVATVLPGSVLAPLLYRSRKDGLVSYGAFAHRYADAYEARMFGRSGEEALGAEEISGMCDLGGSYEVLVDIRVTPWTRRLVTLAVLGALIPMLPLVLAEVGLPELLRRMAEHL